ncbi:MAG TPA: PaaI family thioesterase [Pyrinomonadaceae bacterium]|nr:PaaI family thioesterase [Pyrinomonadaceae bacterium]
MTLEHVPFAKLLGIEVVLAEPGHAVLTMNLRHEHMRNDAIAHGGVVATLIDSAMAIAIMAMLADGERTVTVDLTIHYLRPVTEGLAKASARVVRAGRKVVTVSAELFDKDEKLAATAISTYLRLV